MKERSGPVPDPEVQLNLNGNQNNQHCHDISINTESISKNKTVFPANFPHLSLFTPYHDKIR